MPRTIVEKILREKSRAPDTLDASNVDVSPGQVVVVSPDRVMSHDNSAFIIKKFAQTGFSEVWDREKIAIIFDHCVPAESQAHTQNHVEAARFVQEQKLPHFFGSSAGVSHQVMLENALALPGQLVLGADSHSTIYGAVNALGIPINRTEMAGIWATGTIWLRVPDTIRVEIEGELPMGVYAKDVILKLLAELRSDGASYKSIEFGGSTISGLSMASRMTLTNMAVELGAKAGIMPFDETTERYLHERSNTVGSPVAADDDAEYSDRLRIDATRLEPQVACPHTVDNVKPISAVEGIEVSQAYLGSCTNGRLEDLEIAAHLLRGRTIKRGVRLSVYPASTRVMEEAHRLGVLQALEDAGATIRSASCGPCFGAVGEVLRDGEACVSSSNRNFQGRMGSKNASIYLASPAVVAASCLEGHLADPRRYMS
jgi:homoaconitate hydratase family protein